MTQPGITNPITSTSQLQPDGVLGHAKAIAAFLAPLIGLVIDAWSDGSITTAEWKTIAIAAVTAAVGAYAVANKIKPTPPAPVEPDPNAPAAPLADNLTIRNANVDAPFDPRLFRPEQAGKHETPTGQPTGELGWGAVGPGND